MRCSACSSAVMHLLKNTKDIENPELNAITGIAEFDAPDNFKIDEVIAEINALGYKAQSKKEANRLVSKDKYFNLVELIILIIFGGLELYVSMMNMFMVPNAVPPFVDMTINPIGYAIATLVLAIPVMVIGFKFFIPGTRALFKLRPNMESLVTLGAVAAFISSLVWSILIFVNPEHGTHWGMNVIFDSATMVIVFVYLGKYIEQINNNKAKSAINNLLSILPTDAEVIRDDKIVSVCVNDVQIGDVVVVKPGERSPVDGMIVNGETTVDTSSITGESKAALVKAGDDILAGSIVLNNTIEVQAQKMTSDATVNNILYLVSKSQFSKSKTAKLIDTISFWFVPIVLLISILTFIVWIFVKDITFATTMFVSTLVVACPCAIGLAIPLANVNATTTAIKNGFVYRNVDIAGKLKKINTFVFDKTGTLTNGKFEVKEFDLIDKTLINDEVLSLVYALENQSAHPIATSLVKFSEENSTIDHSIKMTTKFIPGLGLEGTHGSDKYFLGNYRYFENESGLDESRLYFSKNGQIIASFYLVDEIEKGAKELLTHLRHKNYRIIMLTGDGEKSAARVAKELGITEYKSQMFPSEKFDYISDLKANGAHICYIGDGINDAPSLSLSDLSISPYMSSDIATDSSDVYLLKSDLSIVIDVLGLSKMTSNIINLNIVWAFGYNILAMIMATGVFYSINEAAILQPWMSALAMSLSSILVVITSLFIKIYRSKRQHFDKKSKKIK